MMSLRLTIEPLRLKRQAQRSAPHTKTNDQNKFSKSLKMIGFLLLYLTATGSRLQPLIVLVAKNWVGIKTFLFAEITTVRMAQGNSISWGAVPV